MNAPSRFSQAQFNVVAPLIGATLKAYPNAVLLTLASVSVETLARKFREGLEAKKRFGWKHPLVDDALFIQHVDSLRTSMSVEDGKLYAGTREALLNAKLNSGLKLPLTGGPGEVSVSETAVERLAAIWPWLNPRPTNFIIVSTSPSLQLLLDYIEKNHDMAFSQLTPNTWSII